MRRLTNLLVRFRRDESGAFAMIFAVIAIVLVATAGATVDFTGVQQARTRAQVALDAAALALQPSIYNTGVTASTIQPQAQALLVNRLADAVTTWSACASPAKAPCATVALPVIDTTNGTLTLTANLQVPLNFVSLIGLQSMPAQIVSVATRKKLNLEVALVLDNSGSMGTAFGTGTRMTTLKASATCASNILFYGVTTCSASTTGLTANPNVKMAVVPFNDEVNIGTANASATWLDLSGGSDNYFANDNFDSDDDDTTLYNGSVSRMSLFNGLTSKTGGTVPWGGCVEARYNNGSSKQYDTDDTAPTTSDRQTLFTPLFAPDEPDSGSYGNNYLSDTPAACNKTGPCSVTTPYNQSAATTTTTQATTVTTVVTVKTSGKNGKTTTTTTTNGPNTDAGYPTTTTTTTFTSNGSPSATATNSQGITRTTSTMCSCTGQTILSNTTTSTGSTTTSTTGPTTTTNSGYPQTPPATVVTSGNTTTTTTVTTTVQTTVSTSTATTPVSNVQTCNAPYAPWAATTQASGGLSQRVMQERLCKYTGAVLTKTISMGVGPNADCPVSAVQPLTATPSTITAALNTMVSGGNTNIQEGSAWGFRVLSPTEPFTEGAAYTSATSKVMIIMTDGENTYSTDSKINGASLYAAYGYPWDNYRSGTTGYRGRMGDSGWTDTQYAAQINSRLSKTCTNAKAAGITVYTIGLATSATSDPTGNTTLLTNCASPTTNGQAHAFFPTTAADLQQAFVDIANQLAALRLSQ